MTTDVTLLSGRTVRHFFYDAFCIFAMVLVGTRNHDTDTGVLGVLYVAMPFWIALALAWMVAHLLKRPSTTAHGVYVWIFTVGYGMVLRNMLFDRGTAAAFIVVASVFLGISMNGWRIIATRND